ncbi:MAG: CpsD/CapB family tyrosine-protein kinase [Clostridiales bacterium]|nr:CpsD/CapB family tyrosine-protein kinase [Clostridiales bacterium]
MNENSNNTEKAKAAKPEIKAGRKNKNSTRISRTSTLLDENSPFRIKEAYKTLRTNLLFALASVNPNEHPTNIITITSTVPGEGKSTTCANLALTMADKQERVLILDADMRKAVQHRIWNVDNTRGLSTVLIREDNLSDAVAHNIRPNLDLLPAGVITPNPSELLGSESMRVILSGLADIYDYIFIDTPPLTVVSDAMVVAPLTSGVLMAVRPNYSTHDKIRFVLESMSLANVKLLGFMMSCVEEDSLTLPVLGRYYGNKYGYYKYRKYGYSGYGYDRAEPNRDSEHFD